MNTVPLSITFSPLIGKIEMPLHKWYRNCSSEIPGRRDLDCSLIEQVRSEQITKLDHSLSEEKKFFREGLPKDRGQNDVPKKEINLKL